VRGIVPITINANAIPQSGYMTVEINDEFTAAVARPQSGNTMSYMWDTRADFADTGAPPRDGQYTLRVKSYDASEDRFRFLRSNELNVYVRNRISVAPTKTFRLAYSLSPDAQWQYTEKITAKQQGQQVYAANIPFTIMINEVTGGVASATERINRRAVESNGGQVQPYMKAGRGFPFTMRSNGAVTPSRKMQRTGVNPILALLVFPANPVKLGDTWTNTLQITPYYNGIQTLGILATHKLDSFEYYLGKPAAKIVSTYDGSTTATIQGTPTPVKVSGTRITFFDHVRGRLLRSEDIATLEIGTPAGPGAGPGATPYIPGMPGGPSGGGVGSGTVVNLNIITTNQ
jgi:hypothetical protein